MALNSDLPAGSLHLPPLSLGNSMPTLGGWDLQDGKLRLGGVGGRPGLALRCAKS